MSARLAQRLEAARISIRYCMISKLVFGVVAGIGMIVIFYFAERFVFVSEFIAVVVESILIIATLLFGHFEKEWKKELRKLDREGAIDAETASTSATRGRCHLSQ